MLLRRLTDFILSSRLRAVGAAFAVSFLPFLGSALGVLVASLVTLRKGALEGSWVFCAVVAASLFGYFALSTPQTAQLMAIATWVGFVLCLLTWLLVLVLRVSSSWALVVELGALIGLLVILGLHWAFPGLHAWWAQQLTAYIHQTGPSPGYLLPISPEVQAKVTAVPPAVLNNLIVSLSHSATGFWIAFLLLNTLVQVVLARGWETAMFMPGQLRHELRAFRPGSTVGAAAVLLLVLKMAGSLIALDMLPVFVMVFALAGLSLIHALMAKVRRGWIALLLVYLCILMFPFSLVGVAVPGLLDVWLDFRKRMGVVQQ